MLFFSCVKKNKNQFKAIDSLALSYIDTFKKNKRIKQRDFLLQINKDSTFSDLKIYRLNMWSELLSKDKEKLPNKLSIYKGVKIAFFTKEVFNKEEVILMKDGITIDDFYKKTDLNNMSNYPEWVVINKDNNQLIVRDMWYHPIDSIIKRHKKEIEKWDN